LNLEEKYRRILTAIHESKNERFESDYVEAYSISEKHKLKEDLSNLIKADFVEFDKNDDAYYLTTEGYKEVEIINIERQLDENYTDEEIQKNLKESKKNLYTILIGGSVLLMLTIIAITGIGPTSEFHVTPDVLNKIQQNIEIKKDSLMNQKAIIESQ